MDIVILSHLQRMIRRRTGVGNVKLTIVCAIL